MAEMQKTQGAGYLPRKKIKAFWAGGPEGFS
jgi:hypothetical protein